MGLVFGLQNEFEKIFPVFLATQLIALMWRFVMPVSGYVCEGWGIDVDKLFK